MVENIPDRDADRQDANDAWGAFGTIAGGVVVWGGGGLLLDRWLEKSVFTPVGLLIGTGAALYLVWVRYGKQ